MILSLGRDFVRTSGSKLLLLIVCGIAAATGNATSDLCVLNFGWKASILASTSDLNAGYSGDLIPDNIISALLVFLGLGKVALFNVISILLDIFGSSCGIVVIGSDMLDDICMKKKQPMNIEFGYKIIIILPWLLWGMIWVQKEILYQPVWRLLR